MRSRDEVLREFCPAFPTTVSKGEVEALADRLRELESQQAASEPVVVTDAMVEAAAKCLRQRDEGTSWCTWDTLKWQTRELYMDEARAVLTAALARPTTPTRGSDE